MKLDKVGANRWSLQYHNGANMFTKDNSGTIDREEFLSLPQVNSNPLATRYFLPLDHTPFSPF